MTEQTEIERLLAQQLQAAQQNQQEAELRHRNEITGLQQKLSDLQKAWLDSTAGYESGYEQQEAALQTYKGQTENALLRYKNQTEVALQSLQSQSDQRQAQINQTLQQVSMSLKSSAQQVANLTQQVSDLMTLLKA